MIDVKNKIGGTITDEPNVEYAQAAGETMRPAPEKGRGALPENAIEGGGGGSLASNPGGGSYIRGLSEKNKPKKNSSACGGSEKTDGLRGESQPLALLDIDAVVRREGKA